jgi:D-amino-acid oxidase
VSVEALVVGAGVIGLTTGIRLAEAGTETQIITLDEPLRTTSMLATAMVGPTFGLGGPRASQWEAITMREVTAEPFPPGVHRCRGRFVARQTNMIPPGADLLPDFAVCDQEELPEGYHSGFWATVPLIDMAPYLDYLVARFTAAGGEIKLGTVTSLSDAVSIASKVANCSGLGARELVPDPEVTPLRGPKLVVENPGLDTFLIEGPPGPEFTSYHPHGNTVVLGGSARIDDDTRADPDEEVAIIARCAAVEPRLRDARVLEHRVGLRPSRPQVRLETQQIEAATVVHNYGHATLGVTLAWGCAEETARLLMA